MRQDNLKYPIYKSVRMWFKTPVESFTPIHHIIGWLSDFGIPIIDWISTYHLISQSVDTDLLSVSSVHFVSDSSDDHRGCHQIPSLSLRQSVLYLSAENNNESILYIYWLHCRSIDGHMDPCEVISTEDTYKWSYGPMWNAIDWRHRQWYRPTMKYMIVIILTVI